MKNKLLQMLGDNARADRTLPAVRADVAGDVAHIYVYDVIDSYWGASAKALVEALDAAGEKTHRGRRRRGHDAEDAGGQRGDDQCDGRPAQTCVHVYPQVQEDATPRVGPGPCRGR